MDQTRVLGEVVDWAERDDNVRLVVITGSMARGPEHVDALSDLDVELYVRDPSRLLDDRDWYRPFGEVLAVEELENPGWSPTRLVYYVDGKIDFMIGALDVIDRGVRYDRAFRVLVDKDGLAGGLGPDTSRPSPPAAGEFRRCLDWFTAAALMEAKCIVRDEPWAAKGRDSDIKDELLTMIEWDHRIRYGWDHDTWYLGKHMREWMDQDVQEALESCWARFDLEDTRAALFASIELFDRLCSRTAAALAFEPFAGAKVRAEIERILSTRRSR